MVTKAKKAAAKKKVKVLNLKKETIKNLTRAETARIKGGINYTQGSVVRQSAVIQTGACGGSIGTQTDTMTCGAISIRSGA